MPILLLLLLSVAVSVGISIIVLVVRRSGREPASDTLVQALPTTCPLERTCVFTGRAAGWR
jgi:hypothetical protein